MELTFTDSSNLIDKCKIAMFMAEKRGDIRRQRQLIVILCSIIIVLFFMNAFLYWGRNLFIIVFSSLVFIFGLLLLIWNKKFINWYFNKYYEKYYKRLYKAYNIPEEMESQSNVNDEGITVFQDGASITYFHSDFIKNYEYDAFHVLEYKNLKFMFIKKSSVSDEEYSAIIELINKAQMKKE